MNPRPQDGADDALARLDAHLDAATGRPPAPVDRVVALGRRVRRRRAATPVAGAAAAVVAVVGVAAGVTAVFGPAPLTPDPGDVTPAAPSARTVGFGGIVLDLPSAWTTERPDCPALDVDLDTPLTVFAGEGCEAVRVDLGHRGAATPLSAVGGERTSRNGVDLEVLRGCGEAGGCLLDGLIAVAPGHDVEILVSGPDAAAEGVLDTLRATPESFTAVPPIDLPATNREVCPALLDAGLHLDHTCRDALVHIGRLDPPPGTVLPVGSAVTGSPPDQRLGFDAGRGGVVVDLPRPWTRTPPQCDDLPEMGHDTAATVAYLGDGCRWTSVSFAAWREDRERLWRTTPRQRNGLATLEGGSCPLLAGCLYLGRRVVVPDLGVVVTVVGPTASPYRPRDVIDTIRALPTGLTIAHEGVVSAE